MEEPKTLSYDWQYGREELFLRVDSYMSDDNLYIGLYHMEDGYPESFADLTVNLPFAPLGGINEAYIDHNFSKEKLRFIKQHKLGTIQPDTASSGYCIFQRVAFDLKNWQSLIRKEQKDLWKEMASGKGMYQNRNKRKTEITKRKVGNNMEVKMNKEIRDYQESMFWGLSFRQCLFSVLAILAALGIYFVTRKYAGEQVTGWLCVLGAAPFAACGFFRYHGMTAEQFAWAVIKSELLYPKRLVFKSENLYFSCMEESLRLGEKMMGNGAELLEKKRTKQKKPKKRRGRGDAFD